MEDPSLNPYAPSAVADPTVAEEEDRALWRLDFNDLWVRDGAVFEGVDLGTGEVSPPDPVRRKVVLSIMPRAPWLAVVEWLMPLLVGGAAFFTLRKSGSEQVWLAPAFVFVGFVPALIPWLWRKRVLFYYEESRRNQRLRRSVFSGFFLLGGGLMGWCFYGIYSLPARMMASGSSEFLSGFLGKLMGGTALFFLLFAVMILRLSKVPRKGHQSGKWILLRRVAPAAIVYLRRAQG